MAVMPAAAAAAYRAASNIATASERTPSAAGKAEEAGGFSEFLSGAIDSSINTMKHGEVMAARGTAGKADLIDVVTAVNAAEVTLETVVAVRDKVISAYQSIMDMSI